MKKYLLLLSMMVCTEVFSQKERLIYHEIKTDAQGNIIPWYDKDLGKAYNNAIMSVWHFWDTMRTDLNGLPYYMNHQVWKPDVNDTRGIGGDQFQMALSSWRLLYAYCGDERIKEDMKFIAEYYLSHSLSPSNAAWANIPYPYNTLAYAGVYDGDMVIGRDFTQPDKAASFARELLYLYKLTGTKSHGQTPTGIYLDAAIKIANTLAAHIIPGDYYQSPLPFKVNAITGEVGPLKDNKGSGKDVQPGSYTSAWSPALELLLTLIEMNKGDTKAYQKSFDIILEWMKKYPLKNNRWGPFFEDVPGWSDTQINAISFAQFIMNHQQYFPEWKSDVKNIFKWVYDTLGNKTWIKYGVTVINEQTAYRVPGNSHSSREASAELQYTALSGDTSYKTNAIRILNWATYMVDNDGKNRYPRDDIWLSDGYGDYVRHYLRAFAAVPQLAPADEDHILSSTSVIQSVHYTRTDAHKENNLNEDLTDAMLQYTTYDKAGHETIRLKQKPLKIFFDKQLGTETNDPTIQGFQWKPMAAGGLLIINRTNAMQIKIAG